MKKQIFTFIKITALAAILAVGVSYVSAASWSAPGTDATGGNTVAGINTSSYNQTKIGSFATNSFLKAGNAFSSLNAPWNKAGYLVGEKAIISPWSFFTYSFLPGNTSQVKIGSNNADTTDPFTDAITPFTIDTVGRGGYNTSGGRNMIDIKTDAGLCYPNTTIRTNTPSIALYNADSGAYASPVVRGVQLSGGDPAPGKILVSTDANGNAVWATPTLVNGQIVFSYGTSPAATGQALCSAPVPTCTDPDAVGTADDGSCIYFNDEIIPFDLGCFIADTKVTMADGSIKNIQDVVVGDKLKAVEGINTVQKLLRPKLGNQQVYSFNGSDAFFTANHPFLTTDGWKSLDPETTRKEIPNLPVTLMKKGDVLITENGTIVIKTIEKTNKPASTQLYNFELDGDHTYYANGFAVHNKEDTLAENPYPACDINQSTPLRDCTRLNQYYCKIATGLTQGQCIPSRACTTDSQCKFGPVIDPVNGTQLVNGVCKKPTGVVHSADTDKKFCYW